jgi:hypothetical protein
MDGSIIRQATFGINFLTVGLFLLALLFIALVNSKVDAKINEIVTINGYASIVGTTTESEVVWKQPKKTILKSIRIICTSLVTVANPGSGVDGDIGYKVGTSSGGAQIVAAVTDQILDAGTTVPVGAAYDLTLVNTTASGTSPALSPLYASAERNVYFTITHVTAATAAGAFKFIVEYIAAP